MTAAPDIVGRFLVLLGQIRRSGLSDDVIAVEGWIDAVSDPRIRGEMARLLGYFWLQRRRPDKAVLYSDRAAELLPDDTDCVYNAVFALFQLQRWDDVVVRAQDALHRFGPHFQWHNILCSALGSLGRLEEARHHGTQSLRLKDAAATAPPHDLSGVPVPPFDESRPARNIISFSLFGTDQRYRDGAVLNARAARFLYLRWTCRFYVDDSVPDPVIRTLTQEGAQVLKVTGLPSSPYGPLWRFLVADDPEVDRYVIRDADSVLNIREKVAVDAWLDSGRHFHLMRDYFNHSELVLAGMWGGVRGALPPLGSAMQHFIASRPHLAGRTTDQEFLRERLWPTLRQSVLAHDSQFGFGDALDFPRAGQLPAGAYVGCDGRMMLGMA